MAREVEHRVLVVVNSEEDAEKVFGFIESHIREMGIEAAEYFIETATTIAGFDEDELREE